MGSCSGCARRGMRPNHDLLLTRPRRAASPTDGRGTAFHRKRSISVETSYEQPDTQLPAERCCDTHLKNMSRPSKATRAQKRPLLLATLTVQTTSSTSDRAACYHVVVTPPVVDVCASSCRRIQRGAPAWRGLQYASCLASGSLRRLSEVS